jgi:hypothetical protein
MEKNKGILITAVIILLIFVIELNFILIYRISITGRITENNNLYSYTKAICNEENFCEDYVISCNGKRAVLIAPTGYNICNPEYWKDPRPEDQRNLENLCEVSD